MLIPNKDEIDTDQTNFNISSPKIIFFTLNLIRFSLKGRKLPKNWERNKKYLYLSLLTNQKLNPNNLLDCKHLMLEVTI